MLNMDKEEDMFFCRSVCVCVCQMSRRRGDEKGGDGERVESAVMPERSVLVITYD